MGGNTVRADRWRCGWQNVTRIALCLKRSSNRMISDLYRSEDPSPAGSCSVCHIVAPTLTQLSQRRQPFSATMCPDNGPSSVPVRRQMHHQLPDRSEREQKNKMWEMRDWFVHTNAMRRRPYRRIQHFFDFWCAHMDRSRLTGRRKNRTILAECDDYRLTAQAQEIIYCTFRFAKMGFPEIGVSDQNQFARQLQRRALTQCLAQLVYSWRRLPFDSHIKCLAMYTVRVWSHLALAPHWIWKFPFWNDATHLVSPAVVFPIDTPAPERVDERSRIWKCFISIRHNLWSSHFNTDLWRVQEFGRILNIGRCQCIVCTGNNDNLIFTIFGHIDLCQAGVLAGNASDVLRANAQLFQVNIILVGPVVIAKLFKWKGIYWNSI